MEWNELTDGYATQLRALGRSPETIRLRIYWLGRAAAELPPVAELTQAHLEVWLGAQDWGLDTRRAVVASVRGMFRWAVATERLHRDPTALLPPVSAAVGRPRPAPEHAVVLAEHSPDPRVRLAASLAARMGLRRGEIARAHIRDLEGVELLVHGKGSRQRWVPLHPSVPPLLPERGPLVPSLLTGGHLTPAHVGVLLSRALPDGTSGHQLRHRMATAAYRCTRDLRAAQDVLGHASLATTQRYIDTSADDRRRFVAAA